MPLFAAFARLAAGKTCGSGSHEATSGAFGRKAGAARKGPAATSIKTRSRLSSAALFEDWQKLQTLIVHQAPAHSQQAQQDSREMRLQAKSSAGAAYMEIWESLKAEGMPFAGWLLK
jgi:hypothetical protein